MGSRSPDADFAEQAAAHPLQRRRTCPDQRTRRAQATGADVFPVGLVRRRTLRVLEMTLRLALTLWLVSIVLVSAKELPTRTGTPKGKLNLSLFSHSDNCVACHNGLSTPSGEDVSIGATWRSTMMANSARDPYWQAGVRRETIDHPTHSAAIQDECAGCHMPMATRIARESGGRGEVFAHLPFGARQASPPSPSASARQARPSATQAELRRLAADGVSCSVCHQISKEHLGTRESFNGEFVIEPTPDSGVRPIFGPYRVDTGRKTIMR